MGNLIETRLFEEMIEAEEGFEVEHQETEYIHEVNGVTVCEQLEDFLERENMVDEEEVDVITDHLDNDFDPYEGLDPDEEELYNSVPPSTSMTPVGELGQLEMEAELGVGI